MWFSQTTQHYKPPRLESFIREAFIQRQHAAAVFLDLEKAYLYVEVQHHERPTPSRSAL